MKLTKKYRIWWNSEKVIQNDYENDFGNSVTYCGNANFTYFESDNLEDIKYIIINKNLKENEKK